MMFRQVNIDPSHVHLQRILWSPSAKDPVGHYLLLTVTYGEACAPYLANRTLLQLSSDEGSQFPEAANAIAHELYVDDFLSGGHDQISARRRRDQLIKLLERGGFSLKKWVTNEPQLLEDIPRDDRLRPSWLHFSTEGPVNELGVAWDPIGDRFKFRLPASESAITLTKRRALAELARIFDPLGWLAPITLVAKLIIQDLWRAKLTWDEPIPPLWAVKWAAFRNSMDQLSCISLPRWINYIPGKPFQLHAFSDASRRGMAGVVYSRAALHEESFAISILGAKTKLTSIRSLMPPSRRSVRMTIPRLELRAALITVRLLVHMARSLEISLTDCHLWSDSQIVLAWIRSDEPVGNDIVDNCVAQIQEISSEVTWHYISATENPADVASRGADTSKLGDFQLWWSGPEWLTKTEEHWPQTPPTTTPHHSFVELSEQSILGCATTQTVPAPRNHVDKFSSLNTLLRSTARVRRLYARRNHGSTASLPANPLAPVTIDEIRQAFLVCVRLSQDQMFAREIAELQAHQSKPRTNRQSTRSAYDRPFHHITSNRALRSLTPFLDEDRILRAGGRLTNSQLPYDEKHPVILAGGSHLAGLIIRWGHERSLHAGFQTTYAWVIQRAWIINAKVLVKRHIRECMLCARIAARVARQEMAPLPSVRVTPSRPFDRCGLDYAGPFQVLRAKGHGTASFKGYIALFVCMATKAIHLELVGDLTTASFLGALTRFIGRRGRPSEIWSDNGTNFRGANVELQRLLKIAELDWGFVEGQLAQEGISWKFIPPAAPHFGGLWEAGVKSTKAHLQRVVGPRRLTFEELTTLLVSIESILNSRPLTPPAGDLSDLEALTPSHFLIGTTSTSYPQPCDPESNLEYATHWDLVKGMRDRFWSRWSREYLNTLIQRPKWRNSQPNFCIGDFVVVVDTSLLRPSGQWPMGRIVAVHPGADDRVRAVTVKTASGVYDRPIVKLARLPLKLLPTDATPAA